MKYPGKQHNSNSNITSIDDIEAIDSPNFILFYSAKRGSIPASGQTYSSQVDPDMAKAEAITKLMDLGYTNIDVRAIENAGDNAQALGDSHESEPLRIDDVFMDNV